MQGLRLCSRQSDTPYYIQSLDIHIYSIEELAYYLYQHTFFVEDSFFSASLVTYIRQDLEMPKLAKKLEYMIEQQGRLKELMLAVIEASGYYDEEERAAFMERVNALVQKTEPERMKLQAEFLYKNGKIADSEKRLQDILKSAEQMEPLFLAGIYYDLGKIKMQRFLFQEGRELFAKAYGYCQEELFGRALVRSLLMMFDYEGETKDALVNLVKEHLGVVEVSEALIVETVDEVKKLALYSEMTPEYETIESLGKQLDSKHLDTYYQGVQVLVEEWKCSYRRFAVNVQP